MHHCALILSLIFALIHPAHGTEFRRGRARKDMLSIVQNLPETRVVIENLESAPESHRELLRIYVEEYLPRRQELQRVGQEAFLLRIAVHRALYGSSKEKARWEARFLELSNRHDQLQTSPEFKAILQRMGAAAEGLSGELAEVARRKAYLDRLGGFGPEEMPLLERQNALEQEIERAALESPAKVGLQRFNAVFEQTEAEYLAGRISYQEAIDKLASNYHLSYAAYGQEFAPRVRGQFNEMARIKSQLAKAKGFKTWAEYSLAQDAHAMSPGYQTVSERLSFLRSFLTNTEDVSRRYLQARASQTPGADPNRLSRLGYNLLSLKADTLAQGFFPIERIDATWDEAMARAGFPPEIASAIRWDNLPRKNKYGHAYMAAVIKPSPRTRTVDAATLNVNRSELSADAWNPAHIFVVQNFRGGSPDNLRTKLHEGGHALEYILRADWLDTAGEMSTTAQAETHSTFMEAMMHDPLFWEHHARTANGVPISPELVKDILNRKEIISLVNLRWSVKSSLFDLELWNVDYDQPDAPKFFERMLELTEQTDRMALITNFEPMSGVDPRYSVFATEHYYSGEVGYIGYVYAEIAAAMIEQHLLDHFERTTGRRGIYNQPELARLLTEGLYRSGFEVPFPENVERFTNLEYDPQAMARLFNSRLSQALENLAQAKSCEEQLKNPAGEAP